MLRKTSMERTHMASDTPQTTLLNALPLWAQAVSLVGFPIFVAGFYMAKEVGLFPSILSANATVLTMVVEQHREQIVYLQESIRLQREVCRNTAKTPESLRSCNQGE